MRGDQTAAWQGLAEMAKTFPSFDLRNAFATDVGRAAHFSQEAPGMFADLSKNHWDAKVEVQLLALAQLPREWCCFTSYVQPRPQSTSLIL